MARPGKAIIYFLRQLLVHTELPSQVAVVASLVHGVRLPENQARTKKKTVPTHSPAPRLPFLIPVAASVFIQIPFCGFPFLPPPKAIGDRGSGFALGSFLDSSGPWREKKTGRHALKIKIKRPNNCTIIRIETQSFRDKTGIRKSVRSVCRLEPQDAAAQGALSKTNITSY